MADPMGKFVKKGSFQLPGAKIIHAYDGKIGDRFGGLFDEFGNKTIFHQHDPEPSRVGYLSHVDQPIMFDAP